LLVALVTFAAMTKGPSPLVGYNTNVRHKGKLYHIQTEDSGIQHPHIITHLFADGGRIIASRKTSYADFLGSGDLRTTIKKLMQDQHKAMLINLRDGGFDENEAGGPAPAAAPAAPAPVADELDVDALERAADARVAESQAHSSVVPPGSGRYQPTVPAAQKASTHAGPRSSRPESIFGGSLLSEKSLDEVILSYLSDDTGEPDR
jgi:hypothetical protein